jgi:hypothetical protein
MKPADSDISGFFIVCDFSGGASCGQRRCAMFTNTPGAFLAAATTCHLAFICIF